MGTPAGDGDGGKRFFLDLETINPNLKKVQYAVRGPVLDRAMEIDRDLAQVRCIHVHANGKLAGTQFLCDCMPSATSHDHNLARDVHKTGPGVALEDLQYFCLYPPA